MPAPIELSPENFKDTIDKQGTVFIDWWAPWCGPCRSFAPIYEGVAAKHDDIVFAKINTEDQAELSGAFQIQAIPTLMVFRDGILLFSQAGALPANALEELVKQVQALDMEEVRKKVAEQQASKGTPADAKS